MPRVEARRPRATGCQFGPGSHSARNDLFHFGQTATVDQRTHGDRGVKTVTQLDRLGAGDEALDESVVQAFMDVEAVTRHAHLARIGELGRHSDG